MYDFMPPLPAIIPPVGKSGPGITSIISSIEQLGLSIIRQNASINSPKLCGGIFVAIPTAIPEDPFINNDGNDEGKTVGSVELSL